MLLAGQLLIAPPLGVGWGPGETMILAATLLWSVEVILAKRLLAGVSAPLLAASRMGLGFVILAGYLVVSGRSGGVAAITADGVAVGPDHGRDAQRLCHHLVQRPAPRAGDRRDEPARRRRRRHRDPVRRHAGQAPSPAVVAGYLLVLAGVGVVSLLATRPRMTRDAQVSAVHA